MNDSLLWTDLAQKFFRNPEDPKKPLKIYQSQKNIIHFLQFGVKIGDPVEKSTRGAIINSPRGAGKTWGSCIAAAIAACLHPCDIGLYGINLKTAMNMIRIIKKLIMNSAFAFMKSNTTWSKLEMVLEFPNGGQSYIKAHASSQGLRGGHWHYGIVDEASRVPDDILIPAILPTFRRKCKHWIMISTPLDELSGAFYNFWHLAQMQEERGEKQVFTRIQLNPITDGWLSEEQLEYEVAIMGEYARNELFAEFIPKGGLVFPREWIDKAMQKNETPYHNSWNNNDPKHRYVLGVDFGKFHSNTSIAIGHREGHLRYLDCMETFKPPKLNAYEYVFKKIVSFLNNWPTCYMIVPDATGIGDPIIQSLKEYLITHNKTIRMYNNKRDRRGFVFDVKSKTSLIQSLENQFELGYLRLPYHFMAYKKTDRDFEAYKIFDELMKFAFDVGKTGILYGKQSEKDDRVISLALMNWGLKYRPLVNITPGLAK